MATDIAFALGVLALAGRRAPLALKVFLTALAIVDDIGAVVVIALFYTAAISWTALAVGLGLVALLAVASRVGVRSPLVYALVGAGVWAAFLDSGVHATIAGVLVAATIPAWVRLDTAAFLGRARDALDRLQAARPRGGDSLTDHVQQHDLLDLETACERAQAPVQRLEHALHPWVSFAVMPIFALANAGVALDGGVTAALAHPVTLAVVAGLVVGKQVGITLAAWLAATRRASPADGQRLAVAARLNDPAVLPERQWPARRADLDRAVGRQAADQVGADREVLELERVPDPHDRRLTAGRAAQQVERRLDALAVGRERHRRAADQRVERGQGVEVRLPPVDRLDQPPGREVGQPEAGRVPVRGGGQAEHRQPREVRLALAAEAAPHADHVRVHAGPRDVLAHLVDDQQVGAVERDARHGRPGDLEQGGVGRVEAVRRRDHHPAGSVVGVLDRGRGRDRDRQAAGVDLAGAVCLAEADGRHLAEAALDRSPEAGVRLDAPDHDDPVGAGGAGVHVDRHALWRAAEDDRLHRRADLDAEAGRRDAVAGQHLALPLGRPAAVAAHGRDDEGARAERAQLVEDRADDLAQRRDAPAADREGDLGAGPQAGAEVEAAHPVADRGRQVGDRVVGEALPDRQHGRQHGYG
jgi:hypothetical protein